MSSALFLSAHRLLGPRANLRFRNLGRCDLDPPRLICKHASDNGRTDICQQLLEQFRRTSLILHERIALSISLEADRYAQSFDLGKVLHPQLSDGREE